MVDQDSLNDVEHLSRHREDQSPVSLFAKTKKKLNEELKFACIASAKLVRMYGVLALLNEAHRQLSNYKLVQNRQIFANTLNTRRCNKHNIASAVRAIFFKSTKISTKQVMPCKTFTDNLKLR